MRFAAALVVVAFAAPAFAQQAPKLAAPAHAPPPEGFYNGVPNAYDLLLRPQVVPGVSLVSMCRVGPLGEMTDKQILAQREACKSDNSVRGFIEPLVPQPKR